MHPSNVKSSPDIDLSLSGKVVLLSGLTLSSYALFGISPILPEITAHFADMPNAGLLTRMLISATGFVVAIASPVVGAIADRFGPRRVLLFALFSYAVVGCAPFFLNDLYAILFSRILMGFAVAAVGAVILVILVTRSQGTLRDRWLGYLNVTATVVSILYAPLVGYVGHFGWRWPFLTFALVLPLFFLTLVGITPDSPRVTVDDDIQFRKRFTLGTPPSFIAFALGAGAVLVSSSVYIPFRIREIGVTDSINIGLLLIPASITGVISGLCYGSIRSKLSLSATFVVGFTIIAIGLTTTALAQQPNQIVIGQLMTGLGTGLSMPNYFLLASITGSDVHRARTMGFAKSGIYGGPMLGQLLFEPIIARTNFKVVLILLSVGCMAFALHFVRCVVGRRPVTST